MEIEKGMTPNGSSYIQFQDYWDTDCKLVGHGDFLRFTIKSGDQILASEFAIFSQEQVKTLLPYLQSFAESGRLEPSPSQGEELRNSLGKLVRTEWINWAREQANPKSSWLVEWEDLGEPDKEVDHRIGMAVFQYAHSPLQGGGLLHESIKKTASLVRENLEHEKRIEALEMLVGEWRIHLHDSQNLETASQHHLWEECNEEILEKTARILGEDKAKES